MAAAETSHHPSRPRRPAAAAVAASAGARRSKRERKPANHSSYEPLCKREAQQMHVAIEVSKHDRAIEPVRAGDCPVFTPTEAEFRDPIAYLRSVASTGRKYGIAKIVPPKGWHPGCGVSKAVASRPMATREQHVHKLQEAEEFDDGPEYTLSEYKSMADQFARQQFPQFVPPPAAPGAAATHQRQQQEQHAPSAAATALPATQGARETGKTAPARPVCRMPFGSTRNLGPASHSLSIAQEVEDTYWRIVETQSPKITVHYANDLDVRVNGSGFVPPTPHDEGVGDPDAVPVQFGSRAYYRRCGWNLRNMPRAAGSLLKHMENDTAGINVPWLYVGMLFASFAWHTEDNYLYSVNYMHYGTAKTWYGVPSRHATRFDETVKKHRFWKFKEEPDLIHKLTTIISPSVIQAADIPVYHTVQEPGEFIITFPRAYHCGFSHGFNIAEACNFALPDWVPMGRMALLHYERVARETCFSHEEVIINAAKDADKHDEATCTLLAKELRIIAEREREDRAHFFSLPGVTPALVHRLDGSQQRYNCAVSKRMCYVSAVVCQSQECRAEAEAARAKALQEYTAECRRLLKLGVDPSSVVEPDPEHNVVMPRFADSLCDCTYDNLRMVTWFDCDELVAMAAALEARAAGLLSSGRVPCSASAPAAGAAAAASSALTPERPQGVAASRFRIPALAQPAASAASHAPAAGSSGTSSAPPRPSTAVSKPSCTPTRSQASSPSDGGSAVTAGTASPRPAAAPTKL